MAYTIMISEEQRAFILEALRAHVASGAIVDPDNDDLALLIDMVEELPDVERENPEIIHGLCL